MEVEMQTELKINLVAGRTDGVGMFSKVVENFAVSLGMEVSDGAWGAEARKIERIIICTETLGGESILQTLYFADEQCRDAEHVSIATEHYKAMGWTGA
jgi:hypothetical protein